MESAIAVSAAFSGQGWGRGPPPGGSFQLRAGVYQGLREEVAGQGWA